VQLALPGRSEKEPFEQREQLVAFGELLKYPILQSKHELFVFIALENFPSGQGEHCDAPWGEKKPKGQPWPQAACEREPVWAFAFPASQSVHTAAPVVLPYFPGGHNLQEDWPVNSLWLPKGHSAKLALPCVGQNVPAGHKKHWEDPIKEYFPALQRVQFFSEVDPEMAGLNEPARQRVQAEEEVVLEKDPLAHDKQARALVEGLNFPFSQLIHNSLSTYLPGLQEEMH